MATQLEVLITARDEITPVLRSAEKGMRRFGDTATETAGKVKAAGEQFKSFGEAADRIDRGALKAQRGFGAMSDAARLAGANVSGISGPLGMASNAVGDFADALGGLGIAAGVIGVVVMAIGALIAKFIEVDAGIKARTENIHKSFDDLRETFAPDGVDAATEYARALGMTVTQLQAVAKASDAGAQSVRSLIDAQEKAAQIADSYDRIIEAQRTLLAGGEMDFFSWLGHIPAELDAYITLLHEGAGTNWQFADSLSDLDEQAIKAEHSASVLALALHAEAQAAETAALQTEYAAAAAKRLAEAMGDTRSDAIKDLREGARSVSEMNSDAFFAKNEFKEGVGWIEKIPKASAAATKGISSMEQAAKRVNDKLKSLVETALSPTNADPNAGASWDEARKRFEAFQAGTPTDAYGADFQKMFEGLGMSAQAAADAFKNFSLFADPVNMKLIDWAPIVASVEQQLLSMAGKANVTAEAMKQVWANLSPTAKAALAEQGIENASEAMQALVDPAGLAEEQVSKLGDAVRAIPNNVTTVFTAVTDSAKAAIQDLADFLDKFINAYGVVNVSAQGDFYAPTSPTTGGSPPAGAANYGLPPTVPINAGGTPTSGNHSVTNRESTQNNNVNIILPNVRTERDAQQIANALQRITRNAMLRAAQGLT